MIIEELKLKNYRQYRSETIITLGASEDKNINIIEGSTGVGKTNISNAIQWCFYNNEPSLGEEAQFPIFNLNAFKELEEGKTMDVSVEVVVSLDNGEKYSLERMKTIRKKNGEAEFLKFSGPTMGDYRFRAYFHRTAGAGNSSYDINYPDTLISILAPEKISEYFFFDGEKLDKYFKPSRGEKIRIDIRDSVFKVSQLDLLAEIEERLESIIKDYRQETRGLSPELDNITAEISGKEAELKSIEEDITKKNKNLLDVQEKKANLLREYKDFGGENVKRILERNEEIKKEIEQKKEELVEKEKEKYLFLMINAYLFWGMDAFRESLVFFKEAHAKKEIPPNISLDFINDLLKEKLCICGTGISESKKDKEARANVEKLLKEISSGIAAIASELLLLEKDIISIKENQLKICIERLNLLNTPIKDCISQIDHSQRELDNNLSKPGVGEKESKAKLSKMENYDQRIADLEKEMMKLAGDIAVSKEKKETCLKELEDKKSEFKKQIKKKKKGAGIDNLIAFCEKSKECAFNIKSKIMNEIRKEIADETEKHYKELHWKEERGEEDVNVIIDEEYRIFAIQNKLNKIYNLSDGERTIFTMSFLIALNHVSGFNVPIVMDSPITSISIVPKENFSKKIVTYLKENQIIFLFTEVELSPEVKNNLAPATNHHYVINKALSSLEAKIKKIK